MFYDLRDKISISLGNLGMTMARKASTNTGFTQAARTYGMKAAKASPAKSLFSSGNKVKGGFRMKKNPLLDTRNVEGMALDRVAASYARSPYLDKRAFNWASPIALTYGGLGAITGLGAGYDPYGVKPYDYAKGLGGAALGGALGYGAGHLQKALISDVADSWANPWGMGAYPIKNAGYTGYNPYIDKRAAVARTIGSGVKRYWNTLTGKYTGKTRDLVKKKFGIDLLKGGPVMGTRQDINRIKKLEALYNKQTQARAGATALGAAGLGGAGYAGYAALRPEDAPWYTPEGIRDMLAYNNGYNPYLDKQANAFTQGMGRVGSILGGATGYGLGHLQKALISDVADSWANPWGGGAYPVINR